MHQPTSPETALPLSPEVGYSIAAEAIGDWHWAKFWQRNERPLVTKWLQNQPRGLGLDAGIGAGPYLSDALSLGHRVHGVDICSNLLKIAAGRADQQRDLFSLEKADIRHLSFEAATFDWALCTRVLSHLPDPEVAILELGRVLKKDAKLLITDLDPEHPYENTTIRLRDRVIHIETYKHSVERLAHSSEVSTCFAPSEVRRFSLRDLTWAPSKKSFPKVYSGPTDHHIFYYIELCKRH